MTAGLLAALWQADTAFPSGGFGFSNGIEGVAGLAAPLDRAGLEAQVTVHLRHRWRTADRVALARAHRAADLGTLGAVDRAVEAAAIVEPLRAGSRRNGGAFVAAHARLGTPGAAALAAEIRAGRTPGHLAAMQGALFRARGIDEATALAVSAYVAVQGLVSAAVRLGLVGALEAQAVVAGALPIVDALAREPVSADDEIASFAPLLDIAAARHARAETRLFAN
jgi:urease accessory protein